MSRRRMLLAAKRDTASPFNPNALVFEVTVPNNSANYIIQQHGRASGTLNCDVEVLETGATHIGVGNNYTVTFPTGGTYTLSITGSAPQYIRLNITANGNSGKLRTFWQWGAAIQWREIDWFFSGFLANIDLTQILDVPNLTLCTSFNGALAEHSGYINNLENWDVSNVTNFNDCLRNRGIMSQDLSGWCVGNTTSNSGWSAATTFSPFSFAPDFSNPPC